MPKPDPYNKDKDNNIWIVTGILLSKDRIRQEMYQEDLLRSICNKFVNNYFYTIKGLDFTRENPSENFTKRRLDKDTLRELQALGIEQMEIEEAERKEGNARLNELQAKTVRDSVGARSHTGKPAKDASEDQEKNKAFRIKTLQAPSIVKQMEQQRILQEDLAKQKSLDYLTKLRKEYDIYGSQRKPLPPIHSMYLGNPNYEFIQKTIDIEAPTDKRVKISSMSDRMYFHAPSTGEMRNEGMHQTLVKTMDKMNNHEQLIERKKLMPTTIREDRMERDFIIYPHFVDFGTVRPGTIYKAEIIVINDNYFLQRVKLVDPLDSKFKVELNKTGPIAMGQERSITVSFNTDGLDQPGDIETEFYILSKYRKYTIEVRAKIGENENRTIVVPYPGSSAHSQAHKPGPGLSIPMSKVLRRLEPREDTRKQKGDMKQTRASGRIHS